MQANTGVLIGLAVLLHPGFGRVIHVYFYLLLCHVSITLLLVSTFICCYAIYQLLSGLTWSTERFGFYRVHIAASLLSKLCDYSSPLFCGVAKSPFLAASVTSAARARVPAAVRCGCGGDLAIRKERQSGGPSRGRERPVFQVRGPDGRSWRLPGRCRPASPSVPMSYSQVRCPSRPLSTGPSAVQGDEL